MSSMSISSSALNVYATSMNVNAHNIANANTQGFKPQDIALQTGEDGVGVEVSSISPNPSQQTSSNSVAASQSVESIENEAPSGTNLSEELVEMKQTENVYTANAKVLKTQDNVLGSLIDATA